MNGEEESHPFIKNCTTCGMTVGIIAMLLGALGISISASFANLRCAVTVQVVCLIVMIIGLGLIHGAIWIEKTTKK